MLFASEWASFRQPGFAPGRRAQYGAAPRARHRRLGMREDRTDNVTPRAFHIHEVAVRILHQPLLFMGVKPLLLRRRVK